jgi:dTDP-4-dehydrorhamnose reductase
MSARPRVLITGVNGLLGGNLLHLFSEQWNIAGVESHKRIRPRGDYPLLVEANMAAWQSAADVADAVGDVRPDAIVHCAAMTNVDACETDRSAALALHRDATAHLAAYAAAIGAHLVHISTDHIFDGTRGRYREDDEPSPLNAYAETKLAGERAIAESGASAAIVRTNFFGFNMQEKHDFAGRIIAAVREKNPITLFSDIVFSPILANTLAGIIARIVAERHTGVIHVAARDACSKYEFGMRLAAAFGLDASFILSAPAAFSVPRPKNMSLNVSAAERIFGVRLLTVNESIARYRLLADAGYGTEIKQWLFS